MPVSLGRGVVGRDAQARSRSRGHTPCPVAPGRSEMASRIKAARTRLGWSQARLVSELQVLASRQGMSLPDISTMKSRVSRWENDHARPSEFYRPLLREALEADDQALGF